MPRTTCPQCRRVCDAGAARPHYRVMCPGCGHDFEPEDDNPRSDWPSRGPGPLRVAGAFLFACVLLSAAVAAIVAWLRG